MLKDNFNYPLFIVCNKCHCIPFISILFTSPITIKTICNCSESQVKSLKSFLHSLRKNNHLLREQNPMCLYHSKEKTIGYCYQCHKFVCQRCIEFHNDNNILPFYIDLYYSINKSFCIECNNLVDNNSEMHFQHKTIRLEQLKRELIEQKIYEFNHCKNEFLNYFKENIGYYKRECSLLERNQLKNGNKRICELIGIIFKNYNFFQRTNVPFPIAFNIIRNTKMNYISHIESEKKPPREMFTIIKESNNLINDSAINLMYIEGITVFYITNILFLTDDIVIISASNSFVALYDLTNSVTIDYQNQNSKVTSLCLLSLNQFASSSESTGISIWSIINNKIVLCEALTYQNENFLKVISLPDNRIAAITEKGIILIWKLINSNYTLVYVIERAIELKNCNSLYCSKNGTLISFVFLTMEFYNIETYKKENTIKKIIRYHDSYYETNDNKLLFPTIPEQWSLDKNIQILIINVITKQMETIVNTIVKFINFEDCYYCFIEERDNEILWHNHKGDIIFFNKKSYKMTIISSNIETFYKSIQTVRWKPNVYLSIHRQRSFISVWSLNYK